MTITFEQLFVLFAALFALYSPASNVGPYATLVGHLSRPDQRKLAFRVFLNVVIVLGVFVWAGELLFNLLGVTPHTLRVAGGIALMVTGLPMMLNGDKEPEGEKEALEQAREKKPGWRSMVVMPMTFPLSIGGTDASYVVSATTYAQNATDLLAISVVVVLFGVVVWLTHLFSPPIGKALGPGGRDILTRVGGIILVAIAVQLIAGGLRGLWPALGG